MSTRGDMLRLARQRLGIRQSKAAEAVGVAQPLLSRVENGLSEPDQEFLNNAAIAYDVPKSFFDEKATMMPACSAKAVKFLIGPDGTCQCARNMPATSDGLL